MASPDQFSGRSISAFSILELLVSVAVLAILLVMMAQIVDGVLVSTRTQNAQMDSVASARKALDMLESDVRSSLRSQTTSILVPDTGSDPSRLAFVTQKRGPDTVTDHRFLAISYATNTDGNLMRCYQSVPTGATNLFEMAAATLSSNGSNSVTGGILAWNVRAVVAGNAWPVQELVSRGAAQTNHNGLDLPSGWAALSTANDPDTPPEESATALEIWIAAVGPESLALLESSSSKSNVLTALSAEPGSWRDAIDGASGIPPQVKSSIRILKKIIPLR